MIALMLLGLAGVQSASGQTLSLESVGARFGVGLNSSAMDFHQAEAFLNWNLPWDWTLDSVWRLQSRLDFSAGWLGDSSADAALGTVGPTLLLRRTPWPVSLEGGISPTFLTRYDFATKNLGTPWQFTAHFGVNFDMGPRVRLSYRFQHMSNAGLDGHNPGLNLHMLCASFLF